MKSKWVKMMLVIGLVILVGVLALQTPKIGNAENEANALIGSWKVTVTPDGMASFGSEAIFSSDGTVTIIEDSGAVGLGVWEKLSGDQYAFTVWEYLEQDGSMFKSKVTSKITLDNKEQYSGPFFFEFMTLDGYVIVSGNGTAAGVRNHIEPMPN